MPIKHIKHSDKPDSSDPSVIQPSDWNSDHAIDATGVLFSRASGQPIDSVAAGFNWHSYLRRKFNYNVAEEYEFTRMPFLAAADYMFLPQNGNIDLIGGAPNTITIAPVPLGISGTNFEHYIAIIDQDPNLVESVKIEGGTAQSGTDSGTLIIRPINNHTAGQYQIWTATAGIQEALQFLPMNGGTIFVAPGHLDIYGPTVINRDNVSIIGQNSALLVNSKSTQIAAFVFGVVGGGGTNNKISNISFESTDKDTSPFAISLTSQNNFVARDIQIQNFSNGIINISGAYNTFDHVQISNISDNGSGFEFRNCDGAAISNSTVVGLGLNSSGIKILTSSNITINNTTCSQCNWGILLFSSANAEVVSRILISNSNFVGCYQDGINIYANSFDSVLRMISIVGCSINLNRNGIKLDFQQGYVRGVNIIGNHISANQTNGMYLNYGTKVMYINIQGNLIADNATDGGANWAGIWIADSANRTTISYNQITSGGMVMNPAAISPGNKHKYGIYIGPNSGENLIIHGNSIPSEGFVTTAIHVEEIPDTDKWLIAGNPQTSAVKTANPISGENKIILVSGSDNQIVDHSGTFEATYNRIDGAYSGQVLNLLINVGGASNLIISEATLAGIPTNIKLQIPGMTKLSCGLPESILTFVWFDTYWILTHYSGSVTPQA